MFCVVVIVSPTLLIYRCEYVRSAQMLPNLVQTFQIVFQYLHIINHAYNYVRKGNYRSLFRICNLCYHAQISILCTWEDYRPKNILPSSFLLILEIKSTRMSHTYWFFKIISSWLVNMVTLKHSNCIMRLRRNTYSLSFF